VLTIRTLTNTTSDRAFRSRPFDSTQQPTPNGKVRTDERDKGGCDRKQRLFRFGGPCSHSDATARNGRPAMTISPIRTKTQASTMSITEAADTLGIGRTLAYELARTGELPTIRLGRRLVVPRRALERLLGDD
jgi:excisionase family DNA binding protein